MACAATGRVRPDSETVSEKMIKARDAQCPAGYMGGGRDVAHAAPFVASDDARHVTGAELTVDGGISAKLV